MDRGDDMITITNKGDFAKTFNFLNSSKNINIDSVMSKYGEEGVSLLAQNTPIDSGKTAESWNYRIETIKRGKSIIWYNTNVVNGVNIAVILQYGHGTQNGGYIEGRDYINPIILPIFERMTEEIWKEVISK